MDDKHIEKLLLEAEQRLQNGTGASQAVVPAATADVKTAEPEQTPAPSTVAAKEKLSVRNVARGDLPTEKEDSAGNNWFNMPKTDLTPEMKRDWQVLRMRNILDPKHQKKNLDKEPPRYSQVGELIAGPTEYFSARLNKKERKKTLLDEAMSLRDDVKMTNKYAGIQKNKTSGKKAFYQKLKQQRRRGNA